jgi:hypothetical protein
MLYFKSIKFKIEHSIFPISLMFPIPREIVESATSVVCSNEWISERKTYFHEYVDVARLLAGGFGVRGPTE